MNLASVAAIMAVVAKGIGYAKTALLIGKDATSVLDAVHELATAAQTNPVTVEQLETTEKSLDAEMTEFNAPLPD